MDTFSFSDISSRNVTCPVISRTCKHTSGRSVVSKEIWKFGTGFYAFVCTVISPLWYLTVAFLYTSSVIDVCELISWTVLDTQPRRVLRQPTNFALSLANSIKLVTIRID